MSQHPVVFVVNNVTAAMTIHTAAWKRKDETKNLHDKDVFEKLR